MPNKIELELKKPLVPCLNNRITMRRKRPRPRFSMEPKSLVLKPPPKELIPTAIRDRPIESTTVPVTTDGKKRRRGFRKKPKMPSKKPPIMDAPIMAP